MKLLLLQTDIRWLSPDENRSRAADIIDRSPAADLIVLPEMFTTGFAVDPRGAAEPDGGAVTLDWMRRTAARSDAAVAGSVAVTGERDGVECCFNRFFFVRPDGSATTYDKRHLFSFGGEHLRYTPGTERVVVEWRGWRILLQICYDLRFPVFARNRGDYDMMICVASWPTVRIHPWNTLLMARAIENVSYAVGVNRTGRDPLASYSGGTALIDFRGGTVAAAEPDSEEAVFCEADIEALRAFRAKFPALNDADMFTITKAPNRLI
ncbi:MAG: amidohydrolase [Alistipes sp.]|jgi:predicted amidohydrolase|nr:amidohydrolase [Alistipes sp.]